MTLRLILTRHAKSSWDDPEQPDHARPLTDRGRRAAQMLGEWLASRGLVPGEVLCSDARRTRETWEGIGAALGADPAPVLHLKPTLYSAGSDVMLAVLRHAESPVVMMIGHNPGIADFAARLVARAPADPDFRRYPTGATLVLTFEAEQWADVACCTGAVQDFVTPRALQQD